MWQKLVIASVIMANEAGMYVSGQAELGVKNGTGKCGIGTGSAWEWERQNLLSVKC